MLATESSSRSAPHAVLVDRRQLQCLFIGLVAVLIGVGIQMVLSSSLTSRPSVREEMFVTRHLMFLAFSAVLACIAARVDQDWLRREAPAIFWGFVLLLVLVLIPGIGSRINGARRWLRMSGLSLQPSELGRIAVPLLTAASLSRLQISDTFRLRDFVRLCWPIAVALPLVIIEPDLGATVFLLSGFLIAAFVGGLPLRFFVVGALVIVPAAMSLLILKPYQLQRVMGFLDSWRDLSSAPWQVRQSLMSLGAGGLQGSGIGNGWQKLSYLPEANTDFVFAVIGEELGLAGTLTICILWTGLLLVGMSLVNTLPERSFHRTLATTLLLQLVCQALANVAVVTALVPPKGVPHPFISYGGTNLLVSVVSVGLIVGLTRPQHDSAGVRRLDS